MALCRKVYNLSCVSDGEGVLKHHERAGVLCSERFESVLEIFWCTHFYGLQLQSQSVCGCLRLLEIEYFDRISPFQRTAMRETFGRISLRSSSRFPLKSGLVSTKPVMFPPGRARLAAWPVITRSPVTPTTMGIVLLTCFKARIAASPCVTTRSTLSLTNSAARLGSRSNCPSEYLYSMTMFFPSSYPSSRNPCRNPSTRFAKAEAEKGLRNPIRGTFFPCCASAGDHSAKSRGERARPVMLPLMWL